MQTLAHAVSTLLFVAFFALFAACDAAPKSGDVCDPNEEEPCGFGGDCIGERCQTRCPCEPGWVCRERRPSDPYSNKFCYLQCSSDIPCPDGWGCADETGFCEYPPPAFTNTRLDYEIYCATDGRAVGEVITCGYTITAKSGDITGTKWSVVAPSTGGGAGEILGADDAAQIEIELTAAGPLLVTLSLTDEERTELERLEITVE